jgi:hypothetical protein
MDSRFIGLSDDKVNGLHRFSIAIDFFWQFFWQVAHFLMNSFT